MNFKVKYQYKGSPNIWEHSFKSKKEAKEWGTIFKPHASWMKFNFKW